MDWVRVVKALDDEWWSRMKIAERERGSEAGKLSLTTSAIAFMLRDCLIVGLSAEDRKRYDDLNRS